MKETGLQWLFRLFCCLDFVSGKIEKKKKILVAAINKIMTQTILDKHNKHLLLNAILLLLLITSR